MCYRYTTPDGGVESRSNLGQRDPSGRRTSVRLCRGTQRIKLGGQSPPLALYSETLRHLGMRPAGGNHKLLRHWVDDVWRISTSHFDPAAARLAGLTREAAPLEEVMVEGSSHSRRNLKRRLFSEGLKQRRCEMCGQDENWRGGQLALILDHINGVPDDHRFENLRILCPNCAATLDTHCGRKNRVTLQSVPCLRCGAEFRPSTASQRYCSVKCGTRWDRRGLPRPGARKVDRPPYEQLMAEIEATSYLAVGRKYGVSGNAIRKWVLAYERDRGRVGGD